VRALRPRPSTLHAVFTSSPPSPRGLPIYAKAMASAYANCSSGNSTSFPKPRNHVDPRVIRYFDLEVVSDNTDSSG